MKFDSVIKFIKKYKKGDLGFRFLVSCVMLEVLRRVPYMMTTYMKPVARHKVFKYFSISIR